MMVVPRYNNIEEVFHDLDSRFIVNLPEEDLSTWQRLFFQLEEAWWLYEDALRLENNLPSDSSREDDNSSASSAKEAANEVILPSHTLKSFCQEWFRHSHVLRQFHEAYREAFRQYQDYKQRVPVCGVAILDRSLRHVLLVMHEPSKRRRTWSFPKGKRNKNESERECAIRETLEETGFDASPFVDESQQPIRADFMNKAISVFVVAPSGSNALEADNSPAALARFQAHTQCEVAGVAWYALSELPTTKSDGQSRHLFWTVHRFTRRLRKWARQERKKRRNSRESASPEIAPVRVVHHGTQQHLQQHLPPQQQYQQHLQQHVMPPMPPHPMMPPPGPMMPRPSSRSGMPMMPPPMPGPESPYYPVPGLPSVVPRPAVHFRPPVPLRPQHYTSAPLHVHRYPATNQQPFPVPHPPPAHVGLPSRAYQYHDVPTMRYAHGASNTQHATSPQPPTETTPAQKQTHKHKPAVKKLHKLQQPKKQRRQPRAPKQKHQHKKQKQKQAVPRSSERDSYLSQYFAD